MAADALKMRDSQIVFVGGVLSDSSRLSQLGEIMTSVCYLFDCYEFQIFAKLCSKCIAQTACGRSNTDWFRFMYGNSIPMRAWHISATLYRLIRSNRCGIYQSPSSDLAATLPFLVTLSPR